MGANDLLIASHAISGGYTLVTDDRDFDRIPDLAVENWLR
jgi:predicted nucleic acid-binding protein